MQPRKHQQRALEAINNEYTMGNRVTIAMACGSGKTLVGMLATEEAVRGNPNAKILVMVPNLPLLDQTMTDWVRMGAFGGDFTVLPVASVGSSLYGDDAVDHLEGVPDSARTPRVEILDNTTKSDKIIEALQGDGRVVVFATYQSSDKIKGALVYIPDFQFDFAVMDEAHRTAGAGKVENSPWQMCLNDHDIPIDKRLFMTATPRIHKARKSIKSQAAFNSADSMYEDFIDHGVSMDDKDVYGPIAFEFSFAEAIAANILSDYKIYAIVVSDQDTRDAARANGRVNLDHVNLRHPSPDELEDVAFARNLAVIAAVTKMSERGLITGMLSFHTDTMRSRRFAKDAAGYLAAHHNPAVSQSVMSHVMGTTPQQERRIIMDDFDAAHKKGRFVAIANCSVLTEGLDVPELDGILFADPKRSKISIVQAVGRAIRLDPNNLTKIASIIIPVFIEDQEDPEQMVDASAFGKLHEVVLALRENDNMSAYFADAILNDARDRESGTESISSMVGVEDLDGNVVSGPESGENTPITVITSASAGGAKEMSAALVRSYQMFAKSCQTRIVGSYATPFERNLAMLKAYKEKNQHCNMPKGALVGKFPIGKVVYNIRDRFYDGSLPVSEADAYASVGLQLTPVDDILSAIDNALASAANG